MGVKSAGKVRFTLDGDWDITRRYDRLCVVSVNDDDDTFGTYCSKIEVPPGVPITNTTYWQLLLKVAGSGSRIFLAQVLGTNKEIGMSQDAITREIKIVDSKIGNIDEFKAHVEESFINVNNSISELRQYTETALRDVLTVVNGLHDLFTELSNKVNAIDDRVTVNTNAISSITTKVNELDDSVSRIAGTVGEMDLKLAQLSIKVENDLVPLINRVTNIEHDLSGVDSTLDEITVDA